MWLRPGNVEKKVFPFFFLENSRPLSPPRKPQAPLSSSGTLDFLSTYLRIDFLNMIWPRAWEAYSGSERREAMKTIKAALPQDCRQQWERSFIHSPFTRLPFQKLFASHGQSEPHRRRVWIWAVQGFVWSRSCALFLVSPVLTISVYNTPTSKHRDLHVFSWKLPLASGFCLINPHSIEQPEMNVLWEGSSANNWPQLLHKHSTFFITWVVCVLDHILKFTGWMKFQLPRVGNCLKQASFFLASLFFLFSLHSAIVFWDHLPSKLLSLSKPRSLRGLACFWGNPKQLTYESNILWCFRILQIWGKNFCVGCCSVSSHLRGSWLHKSAVLSVQPSETAKTLCWLFSQKPAPTLNSLLFFSYLHQQMVPAEQHFKCYLFFLQFPTLWNRIPFYPSNISNSPRPLYRCSNFI